MEIGTYVQVCDKSDGYYRVMPECEQSIDAYVSKYIDSGRTQDSIITLTCKDGMMVKILASEISAWFVSTPESRVKALEYQQAYEEEEKVIKQSLGMWEDV